MENIDKLNELNAPQLAGFFNQLIPKFYDDDADIRNQAFASVVDYGIWEAHSPLNVLEQLFERLSERGKNCFRGAVGLALLQVRSDTYPAMGVRDLLYLVGYTEAYESLSAISSVLADNSNWDDVESELYFNALAVLKGMGKSPQAYETCRKILTTKRFPEMYLFDAYEALTLGRPESWADDLVWLSPRLVVFREWQPSVYLGSSKSWYEQRLESIACNVIAKCSLSTICNGLVKLEESSAELECRKPVGIILIELLKRGGPCQLVVAESGATQLAFRDENIFEAWPDTVTAIDTFLWTLGIVPEMYRDLPDTSLSNNLMNLSNQEPELAAQLAKLFMLEEYKYRDVRKFSSMGKTTSREWATQYFSDDDQEEPFL